MARTEIPISTAFSTIAFACDSASVPLVCPAKLCAVAKGVNLQCASVKFSTARQFERPSNGIIYFGSRIVVVHVEKTPDTTRPRWGILSGSCVSQRVAHVGNRKKYGLSRTDSNRRQSGYSHLLYQLSYGRSRNANDVSELRVSQKLALNCTRCLSGWQMKIDFGDGERCCVMREA